MKDFVLYTCLFGDYMELQDAYSSDIGDFDRVCFTDDETQKSHFWDIVLIEKTGLGPRIESRAPKLLPHRYLADWEHSLYVDARVRFKTNPLELLREEVLQDRPFKSFAHPWRNCVYEEAEVIIEQGICKEADVRRQMDHYRLNGYPEGNGLIAGTVLLRRHNDPQLVEFMELWHSHMLHFTYRDQLSFNFCAWLKGFQYDTFRGSLEDNSYFDWLSRSEAKCLPNAFDEQFFEWMVPGATSSGVSTRKYFMQTWQGKRDRYKRHISSLNRIANKYRTDKGSLYFNAHAFAYIYDCYFSYLRKQPFDFLEIGLLRHDVQIKRTQDAHDDAPSLKMWREYFERARIVGFDIKDFSAVASMPDVTILRGDMGNPADLDCALTALDGIYFIILDDASHASHHQQIAFSHLFPRMAPGGYYVIEDLTSQPRELEEKDAVKTIDVLHGLESGNLVASKYLSVERQTALSRWIEFVHFYDSQDRSFGRRHRDAMAIIKKRDTLGSTSARAARRAGGKLKHWLAGS